MTDATLVQADQKYKAMILEDYRLAYQSRLTSLLGRKEVLTGKAKFGIFGDGKEWLRLFATVILEVGITATKLL
jgi:hypothetical protein